MGGGKTTKSQVIEALGYTPASGENLVLDSVVEISNSTYFIHEYDLFEPLALNTAYTVTIWGEPGAGKTFSVFAGISDGNLFVSLKNIKTGIYSGTITMSKWVKPDDNFSKIRIYAAPRETTGVTSTIHKIKLEPGTVTDPVWTPAPEDVVVRSELDKFFNVPYVDDLLTYASSLPGQNIVHFARTDANTKNTPYSDKITGAREGTAIIIGGKVYSTILFVPIADSTLYTRVCAAGTYGNWYSLTGTERKISSDEPSDDMEIN